MEKRTESGERDWESTFVMAEVKDVAPASRGPGMEK